MKKNQTQIEREAYDNDMSVESYISLKKSIEDHESPIRYVLVSNLFGRFSKKKKWRMFFRVEDDTWASDLGFATLFKRKYYAEAIKKVYLQDGDFSRKVKNHSELVIAKVTTKSNKLKVLKYYAEEIAEQDDGSDVDG